MSKLIALLGTPIALDELESKIRICEGAATMYAKELQVVRSQARSHGE